MARAEGLTAWEAKQEGGVQLPKGDSSHLRDADPLPCALRKGCDGEMPALCLAVKHADCWDPRDESGSRHWPASFAILRLPPIPCASWMAPSEGVLEALAHARALLPRPRALLRWEGVRRLRCLEYPW